MGIKGRKKRERERALRHENDGSDEGSEDCDDMPPPMMLMGGPFAPPPNCKPRLSKSQLYRMQDEDTLEQLREEHANRKNGGNAEKKKKRFREDDDDDAPVPLMEHYDEGALQQLSVATAAEHAQLKASVASGPRFSHPLLGLHESLVDGMMKEGFTRMTKIQQRVLPLALQGYDVLGQAKTGSGKTLAFCVPVLHAALLHLDKAPSSSTSKLTIALMLAPTKELCVQTHGILRNVCQHLSHSLAVQLITGGTSVVAERKQLTSGTHIVVGTPGRINDHVKHCGSWKLSHLKFLVLDEADRMLADGFQRDLDNIIKATPSSRQTFLFSATNSKSVQELARLSLVKTPLFVDTKSDCPRFVDGEHMGGAEGPPYMSMQDVSQDDDAPAETTAAAEDIPSSLKQFCCIVPAEDRLRALYVFVKRVAKTSKAMVFCSTVVSTIFHCQMMGSVGFHNEVLMLHGHMKHRQRLQTFEAFNEWTTGVLFCTDVAARGLDIPNVTWILQYDPPLDPTEYVHRIGRTARAGNVGNSLIFLTPQESNFVRYLSNFGIHMEKYPMPKSLPLIQEKLEHVLQLDPIVAKSAVLAYRAHIGAYQSHILKETFNVHDVDLEGLSMALALTSAPTVTLPKSTADQKKEEYVKGKLKSLNRRRGEAVKQYERMKTKQQWTEDGSFIGIAKPTRKVGA